MFTDSPLISRLWRLLTGKTRYAHTRKAHAQLAERAAIRRRSWAYRLP